MDFLDLPMHENIIDEFFGYKKFLEGCKAIKSIDTFFEENDPIQEYYESVITEALDDPQQGLRTTVGNTVKNTVKTTRATLGAHSIVTTGLANAYGSTFNLGIKLVRAIAKLAAFIFNCIAAIPKAILKLMNLISKIPGDIKAKVKGDIRLYITIEDLQKIYATSLVKKLDTFIVTAQKMTHGDIWGTKDSIGRNKAKKYVDPNSNKKLIASENDKKLGIQLQRQCNLIGLISFTPTTVKVSNEKIRETYFGNTEFTITHDGGTKTGTYLKLMQGVVDDIAKQRDSIDAIQKQMQDKYNRTLSNESWAALSPIDQEIISMSIQSTSKVINTIAKLLKYFTADINTITNATNKMLMKATQISQQVNVQ